MEAITRKQAGGGVILIGGILLLEEIFSWAVGKFLDMLGASVTRETLAAVPWTTIGGIICLLIGGFLVLDPARSSHIGDSESALPSDRAEERKAIIANLRSGVLSNARKGDKAKHPKSYLDGHEDFHAIRKHLTKDFLADLDGSSRTIWAHDGVSVLNPLERRFFNELERLEAEWGIDHEGPQRVGSAQSLTPAPDDLKLPANIGKSDLGYRYPKAVLKVSIEKTTGTISADHERGPHSMDIAMEVTTDHGVPLAGCVIELVSLTENGKVVAKEKLLRSGKRDGQFIVAKNRVHRFVFMNRDMRDAITPAPFMLHLVDGPQPLEERSEYCLELKLWSEYKIPTLATVDVRTGEGLEASAVVTRMDVPTAA